MPAEMFRGVGLRALLAACMVLSCNFARADGDSLWLTTGFRSWHPNESQSYFRQENIGVGLSFETPDAVNVVAGTYVDSDNRRSNYLGAMFQPLNLGGVHLGALAVIVTGYVPDKVSHAFIPVASYEYDWAGINVLWYPGKVTAVELKARVARF